MECPPLVVLPTFDEPGQIIMKELSQEDISAIPEEPQVDDEAVPFDGDYEEDEKSMNEETWGNTDAPDDERICVLTYSERVGPSSTLLESLTINENDAPADENIEFPSRCWDMSPKNKSEWCPLDETEYSDASVSSSNKSEACPIDETESSDASVGSQDATVVVRNEDAKKPDAPETEPGILSPRRVMITQTLEENRDYKLKSPKNHDDIPMKSSIVRRFVNRPILEETSKANVRTEIYESNTTSEISEKDSRELRKDRIRALDAIRPTPTADIPLPVVTLEDDPTIEDITNNPSETLKEQETLEDEERDDVDEVHGLDELMEFHSCDEDFFTSHTDSEFISAGFA